MIVEQFDRGDRRLPRYLGRGHSRWFAAEESTGSYSRRACWHGLHLQILYPDPLHHDGHVGRLPVLFPIGRSRINLIWSRCPPRRLVFPFSNPHHPAYSAEKRGKSVTDRVHVLYRRVLGAPPPPPSSPPPPPPLDVPPRWLTISMAIASTFSPLLCFYPFLFYLPPLFSLSLSLPFSFLYLISFPHPPFFFSLFFFFGSLYRC